MLLGGLGVLLAVAVVAPVGGQAQQSGADLCEPQEAGVNCGPGNGRRPAGGAGVGKVPHDNGLNQDKGQRATRTWPRLSGVLWHVLDGEGRDKAGGPLNDELLGHHGTDRLAGGGGHDILWGDWDPANNGAAQRDVLSGGARNDWIYPSHGRTIVKGGTGSDYVWAYYGKGSIDCGPGIDTARIRTTGAFKTKSCERIRHFCAHGENSAGDCLSPSGRPVQTACRR